MRALGALNGGEGNESIDDLLTNSKGLEDSAFASLYTLTKNRGATSVRLTILRVVVEWLQFFHIVFNSSIGWKIDTDIWIWKYAHYVMGIRCLVQVNPTGL